MHSDAESRSGQESEILLWVGEGAFVFARTALSLKQDTVPHEH